MRRGVQEDAGACSLLTTPEHWQGCAPQHMRIAFLRRCAPHVWQVLDSPFSRLTDLMLEIVVSQRLPIPKVCL